MVFNLLTRVLTDRRNSLGLRSVGDVPNDTLSMAQPVALALNAVATGAALSNRKATGTRCAPATGFSTALGTARVSSVSVRTFRLRKPLWSLRTAVA